MNLEDKESVLNEIERLKFELSTADIIYNKEIDRLNKLKYECLNALRCLDNAGIIDKTIFQGYDDLIKKLEDDKQSI